MTNTLRRAEFNAMFGKLTTFATDNNLKFIHGVDSYYRTQGQQKALFDGGKSKYDGTKTRSKHQDHLARDIFIVNEASEIVWVDAPYAILGAFWEHIGGIWGGHFGGTWGGHFVGFKDIFHFEI